MKVNTIVIETSSFLTSTFDKSNAFAGVHSFLLKYLFGEFWCCFYKTGYTE